MCNQVKSSELCEKMLDNIFQNFDALLLKQGVFLIFSKQLLQLVLTAVLLFRTRY